MTDHVSSSLFIYSKEGENFVADITQNPHGTTITAIPIEHIPGAENDYLKDCQHVVVCAPINDIKQVIHWAKEHFSATLWYPNYMVLAFPP